MIDRARKLVDMERETAALDAIENLLEYAKKDILRPIFMEPLDEFQAQLIEYRSSCFDDIQVMKNLAAMTSEDAVKQRTT